MKKKAEEAFDGAPEKKVKPVKEKKPVVDPAIDVEEKKSAKNKLLKAIKYLSDKYEFRYNVINTDFEYRKKDEEEYKYFDDRDYKDVYLDMKLNDVNISDQDFKVIVYSSAISISYNPFKEFFSELPAWDKQDHIRSFLEQIYLKDEMNREYFVSGFKKWFTALVVSLIEDEPHPFKINQTCLVLVGGQGKMKTTFIKNLMPKSLQLKYFYGSTFLVHEKDHEKFLAYKIIINFDEFAAYNKNDIEGLKSKITQDQIVVRLPYAKSDIHLKRRASFTATTNNVEFLRDDTGSRRWFIVEIDQIALDESKDLCQMYAQALQLYKDKEKYWFDEKDIVQIESHNERFTLRGMEEEMIMEYFTVPTDLEMKTKGAVWYATATQIANAIAKDHTKINVNNTVAKNIGSALRKLGFKKPAVRLNGKSTHLWALHKVYALSIEVEGVAEEDESLI